MSSTSSGSVLLGALSARIGGEAHALPLSVVLDVCRSLPVTRLPGAPAHIMGVAAWRGQVIPCVALQYLGVGSTTAATKPGVIAVLRLSGGLVGVEVGEPLEVLAGGSESGPDDTRDADAPPAALLELERLLPRYEDDAPRGDAPAHPHP